MTSLGSFPDDDRHSMEVIFGRTQCTVEEEQVIAKDKQQSENASRWNATKMPKYAAEEKTKDEKEKINAAQKEVEDIRRRSVG